MAVIERVGAALRTISADIRLRGVVLECRQCGHTLQREGDACPSCGGNEVARIHVE